MPRLRYRRPRKRWTAASGARLAGRQSCRSRVKRQSTGRRPWVYLPAAGRCRRRRGVGARVIRGGLRMKVGANVTMINPSGSNRTDDEIYHDELALIDLVEPLNFDSLMCVEHHF